MRSPIASAAAVALVLLSGPMAVAQSPTPDPYTIFANARTYWETARYPSYLSYTVAIRVVESGVVKTDHYSTVYDARHDIVHVDAVSAEERAHPHVAPGGFNFAVMGARINKPEDPVDFLGVPVLAPNYSFGIAKYIPQAELGGMPLVQQIRREFNDPMRPDNPYANDSNLKEIGSVEAVRHDYLMSLVGVEHVSDHDDYHIALTPTHEPHRYRLRAMWVNARTFATDKLATAGNFGDGDPGGDVAWTVEFAQVDGAPYVASEHANAPLGVDKRVYNDASVSFEDVHSAPVSAAQLGAIGEFSAPHMLVEPMQ